MLALEELLRELAGEEPTDQGLPPGFRFHPTDEELITFYLASKVFNGSFCGIEIAEIDLNRCEPWELPDVAKMGQREWYFFSLRDRKYPTGLRTNRATGAGYWKATGKDREVFSAATGALLGMKKTLVFYKGRAPRGEKTKWVMHEYRLDGEFSCRHTCKEEWVICRIFNKSGEKKSVVSVTSSSSSHHQTTLLDSGAQTPMQNPPQFQQENDFNTNLIVNPVVPPPPSSSVIFPINGCFQSHPSAAAAASMLFKSLLSHQDCNFKEPKQCKTEIMNSTNNFSNFQFGPSPDSWMDKIYPNPLSFDVVAAGDHEAVSVPFNGDGGFPCSSIKVSADSWLLDS